MQTLPSRLMLLEIVRPPLARHSDRLKWFRASEELLQIENSLHGNTNTNIPPARHPNLQPMILPYTNPRTHPLREPIIEPINHRPFHNMRKLTQACQVVEWPSVRMDLHMAGSVLHEDGQG